VESPLDFRDKPRNPREEEGRRKKRRDKDL
jgi:hypothetical protein